MTEEDGSITLALNEIDLVENGKDEKDAKKLIFMVGRVHFAYER